MSRKKTTFEFIQDSKKTHGETYDYSLSVYKGRGQNIKIICKIHGLFEQTPASHINGGGCNKCAKLYRSIKRTKSNEDFIKRAKEIHGDRYDYSKSVYKKALENILIICKIHGEFFQKASSHMNGRGCSICGRITTTKGNMTNPMGWSASNWGDSAKKSKNFDSFKVYIIRCWNDDEEFYKIGRTFRKTKYRFKDNKSMPYNYEIINEYIFKKAEEAFYKEHYFKKINKNNKYIPIKVFPGRHECFKKLNYNSYE